MSYQVLARKWRPRDFDAMVGQEHVLRALVNALDNDRLHHAFLFTGTRGVGKTTIARILAKSLNCEQGVGSKPCGECGACREIDEGRFVDLIEVDAASRTKVEDTRELLDNVQYAPSRGRYKVYLIDEVHMLSNHSFNALLKTLEEPPPHVKFLLATTDPQKLPVTILSRCLQFNLRRLGTEQIAEHLAAILAQEDIENEASALTHLARAAEGSMRDALSLLDQAIAFGAGKVSETDVRAMLGTIDQHHVYGLLENLAQNDAAAVLNTIKDLAETAPDFTGVLAELSSALHYIAVLQQVPEAYDEFMGDKQALQSFAERISPEDVQLYYQIAINGRRDLQLAPDPRSGFEMTLLRMLAFRPLDTASTAVDASPATSVSRTPTSVQRTKATDDVPVASQAKRPLDQRANDQADKAPVANQPPATAATQETKPTVVTQTSHDSTDEWHAMVGSLQLSGVVQQLAMHCALIRRNGDTLELGLDPDCVALRTKEREARLQEAVQKLPGNQDLRLIINDGGANSESPAARAERQRAERQAKAEEDIAQDGNIKALMETFDAQVRPGTVRPID